MNDIRITELTRYIFINKISLFRHTYYIEILLIRYKLNKTIAWMHAIDCKSMHEQDNAIDTFLSFPTCCLKILFLKNC